MQYITVFLDLAKFTDFRWKNKNVSRTQGVCQEIHIFFGSSLGKVQLCQVSSFGICVTIFRLGGGAFCPPPTPPQ